MPLYYMYLPDAKRIFLCCTICAFQMRRAYFLSVHEVQFICTLFVVLCFLLEREHLYTMIMTEEKDEIFLRAQEGDSDAQRELGNQYRFFERIVRSEAHSDPYASTLSEARLWLERSVRHGNKQAAVDLADMLTLEIPMTDENCATAISLYTSAFESGSHEAAIRLGMMSEQGQGMPRDYQLAANYYAKAAASGHSLACFNLALLHQYGRGVSRDLARAEQLFLRAAEGGDALSYYYLAQLLESSDAHRAEHYYRLSLERGITESEYALGHLFVKQLRYDEALPLLQATQKRGGALSQKAATLLDEIALKKQLAALK